MASHKDKERQLLFIEHYLATFNATTAAIAAGYSQKTAYSQGSRLLKNVEIKAAIEKGLTEKVMGPEEVKARLSDMARASLDDVLDPDDEFDLRVARASGKMHLIKSLTRNQFTDKDGNTTRTTKIELHDSQSALVTLAKHHGLLTTKVEIKDWREQARKDGYDPDKLKAELESQFVAAMVSTSRDGSLPVGTGDDSGGEAGE